MKQQLPPPQVQAASEVEDVQLHVLHGLLGGRLLARRGHATRRRGQATRFVGGFAREELQVVEHAPHGVRIAQNVGVGAEQFLHVDLMDRPATGKAPQDDLWNNGVAGA
ncbi:MAG: hypothetical protein GY772_08585, partial [bacterium]|nr:hypothetical protein [bacterium]